MQAVQREIAQQLKVQPPFADRAALDAEVARRVAFIQQCLKMVMVGRNYLVRECVIIFMKIMDLMSKLLDIIMFTDHAELMMAEEKKHLLLLQEK